MQYRKLQRGTGELRPSDVREYGSLHAMLSPGWELPAPVAALVVEAELSLPSISCASRSINRLYTNSRPNTEPGSARKGGALKARCDSRRPPKLGDATPRVEMKSGDHHHHHHHHHHHGDHHHHHHHHQHHDQHHPSPKGISISVSDDASRHASRKTLAPKRGGVLHTARSSMMQHEHSGLGSLQALSLPDDTSSLSGSSSSSSFSSMTSKASKNSSERDILADLGQSGISTDWGMILEFAKDKKRQAAEHELVKLKLEIGQIIDEAPAEPDEVVAPKASKHGHRHHHHKPRPRSPLRPGVYVGIDAPEHSKKRKPPRNLPNDAKYGASGLFLPISAPVRPATSQALKSARLVGDSSHSAGPSGSDEPKPVAGLSMWQSMVAKMEDEEVTDDARAYNAWRKRVVDCTRAMQLEVARFKTDE